MGNRASSLLWVLALAACGGSSQPAATAISTPASMDAGPKQLDAGQARDASPTRIDAAASDAGRVADAAAHGGATRLTPEQLRDPETCKGCHPKHYREWSSSMHAYAALDPVFIAMNKRGQRETNGALGDFCVRCHAPMAVADSLTEDGLNLDKLPDQKRGVSCYFCHNVITIQSYQNGVLRIAGDDVMRGPLSDAIESGAHGSQFSDMFDHAKPEHNAMCGGCHDITINGVELERTFQEFRNGLYGQRPSPDSPTLENCAGCHMTGRNDFAAVSPPGAPKRFVHEHLWPGIDVALTDFPNKPAMRAAIEDCQLGIASVGFFTLDVTPPNVFTFKLETNAGHNQPSGAAQDRRMWLEILAYDADGELIAEATSGDIKDQELEDKPASDPRHDPRLWMFRDHIFDEQGNETHMFWKVAPSAAHPLGYESTTLKPRMETLGVGTHFIERAYELPGANGAATPARITARLRIRPIGMDVLQDLVDSGDLDAGVLPQMPTFTFGAKLEWTQADGFMKTIMAVPERDCESYPCMLDPESSTCP